MNAQTITNTRLRNQQIGLGQQSPTEITRYMGALQAQDYYGAIWSLGLRSGRTEQEVIQAIENLEIVRTWPQRGTLHFVPAADAKWMVSLSVDRLLKGARHRHEQLRLDNKVFAKSREVVNQAMRKRELLTRPQFMDVLRQNGIDPEGGRGYHILWNLSQTGVTFIGPMQGKQQTIGLLDDWVQSTNLTREAGIAELAKRYFISHGPATIQDFMWWSGLTTIDAKAGLEANRIMLQSEQAEGKEYWLSKDTAQPQNSATAFLLPGFDEYMLGYKDRSAALHADHAQTIVPGGNGMFLSTIVIGGQVVGTWKRTIKKNHVSITLAPFKKLTRTQIQLLDQPAQAYGRFLGLPATLE